MNDACWPTVILVGSPRSRSGETSQFLRFVRENVSVLKRFSLYCTEGTYYSLMSTGLYSGHDVTRLLPGVDGGMVEVAATVARGECKAVILLTDPRDVSHEEVLTRVVKRVASARAIRLVTTYADALRWARFEAVNDSAAPKPDFRWKPSNWVDGIVNDGSVFSIDQRTIALTAHHESKGALVRFVDANLDALASYGRVLATGMTGWMLKLLYASSEQERTFDAEARAQRWYSSLERASLLMLDTRNDVAHPDLLSVVAALRVQFGLKPHESFAENLIALPPGFEGGDALIAHEIILHRCDTVLCFYKPTNAFPSIDDVWMFEETCQLPRWLAACVINPAPIGGWAAGLQEEVRQGTVPASLHEGLREKFGLHEVIVVDSEDDIDSDELGESLCRACAGYLNTAITRLLDSGGGRIAVSWGWVLRTVVDELKALLKADELRRPRRAEPHELLWTPSIGVLSTEPAFGAAMIAEGFREFYGGRVDAFQRPGYVVSVDQIPSSERETMESLATADIVLASASPWDKDSGFFLRSGLKPELFPPVGGAAVGTIGGVFLSLDGTNVEPAIELFGLDFQGLIEAAGEHKSVVLVCGGLRRRQVLRAAIWSHLVSVLVTTRPTAEWLLDQPPIPPRRDIAGSTYVRVLIEIEGASRGMARLRIPAWDADRPTDIALSELPPATRLALKSGRRPVDVLAVANLAATNEDTLDLHDFAPVIFTSTNDPTNEPAR